MVQKNICKFLNMHVFILYMLYMCVFVEHMYNDTCGGQRILVEICPLFHQEGPTDGNSGHQAWQQRPLPLIHFSGLVKIIFKYHFLKI